LKSHILKSFGGFESENLSLQTKSTISTTLVVPLQNFFPYNNDEKKFTLIALHSSALHPLGLIITLCT
jgi:hypothetical protein